MPSLVLHTKLEALLIATGIDQTLAQLRALGFTNKSRFYGRVLLPRELQEDEELRNKLGYRWKTIDYHCEIVSNRLVLTRYKWEPVIDDNGSSVLKEDGTQKFQLVPGRVYGNGYAVLKHWNKRGGVYLYPNPGGRKNKDITACPSGYFENDELTFDEQWAAVNDFAAKTGIAPSVIVKTRKSLHVYYRFPESEWGVDNWTEDIQRPLCLAMRSDPCTQNRARLMRLAGFNHVKWIAAENRLDFVPVSLEVCNPERQYTREQLKSAVASVLPQPYSHQRFKLWVYLKSPIHKPLCPELDPEVARSCSEADLDATNRRWRHFIKLSRDKAKGKDVDPRSAFKCDLKQLPRTYNHKPVGGDIVPFEGDKNTLIWAKYQYGYNPHGRDEWVTFQDPSYSKAERHLHSINSIHVNKITGAISTHNGRDTKDVYDQMKEVAEEAIYNELTQLTTKPWKEVNTPNLTFEDLGLESGAVYVVRSAKGTGKTNALIPLIPKFTNVYAWFNRIALGREECNRIGLTWKDDIKAFTGTLKVGFCADSGYTFPPRHLKNNGLLLADEADQVFEHMFGDTCNKNGKRPMILTALQAQLDTVIAGGGMGLFMSADITDKEIAYIQALAPEGCPVRLIVNHYKPERGSVRLDLADVRFEGGPKGLIAEMVSKLEAGVPCFVVDDLRTGVRGCKSIAEYVRSIHPEWDSEIVEINSDTSGDPEIINYLKTINEASKTTRLLCCSPSVVSGVSIENGHFQEVYAFMNGVMTVAHASQAIARVRGAQSINVWAVEEGLVWAGDRSLFPEQIKGYYQRNYESNCKHILAFGAEYSPLSDEWDSPHFDLYCKYAALRNHDMSDFRRHFRKRLEDEGYTVELIGTATSDSVNEGLKEAWHNIEVTHAHAVAAANILSDAQLTALENKALTPDEKLDVEKTYLLKSFGQELIDAMVYEYEEDPQTGEILTLTGFAAMVVKDKRQEYRKQLDSYYLLVSDPDAAIAKDVKAEKKQMDNGDGRFAGDVRWHTRQRKARQFLGLPDFLNPDLWYGPVDFAGLAEKAKKNVGRVRDALGLSVRKMSAGQIFGELMNQVGLELDKKWAPKLSKQGRRYKLRQINPDSWRYAQMYVTYRESLFTATEEATEETTDRVPAPHVDSHLIAPESTSISVTPSGSILSEVVGGGEQTPAQSEQALEVVSDSDFSSDILSDLGGQEPAVVEPTLVSCWKFGKQWPFKLERWVDDVTAVIRSVLTHELFTVPASQLSHWGRA